METIKKNKAVIGIIAGGAAIAAGVIYFLTRKSDGDLGDVEIADETGTVLTEADKKAILAGIKIEHKNGILTIQTIEQICDATVRFSIPQFQQLTRKERKDRRANLNNAKKYVNAWSEFVQRLEELIETNQKVILKAVGISTSDWEASNTRYMQAQDYNFFMIHAGLPQKLKLSLTPTRTLTLAEAKAILKDQVVYMNEEAQNVDEIAPYIKQAEELVSVCQNRVHDKLFEKHGVEEEDLILIMRNHAMDPEVRGLLAELQAAAMKFMPMQGGMPDMAELQEMFGAGGMPGMEDMMDLQELQGRFGGAGFQ